uniref:Uncharacterized protein n=1 Tax=Setaria italica TaxID=4555 RepID=K3XM63_SETIT
MPEKTTIRYPCRADPLRGPGGARRTGRAAAANSVGPHADAVPPVERRGRTRKPRREDCARDGDGFDPRLRARPRRRAAAAGRREGARAPPILLALPRSAVARRLAQPLRLVVSVSTHLPARPEPALALRDRANAGARAFRTRTWLVAAAGGEEWCPWTGCALVRRRKEHGVPPPIRRGGVRCSPSRRRHSALEETRA